MREMISQFSTEDQIGEIVLIITKAKSLSIWNTLLLLAQPEKQGHITLWCGK